jgi:hypothetical protein
MKKNLDPNKFILVTIINERTFKKCANQRKIIFLQGSIIPAKNIPTNWMQSIFGKTLEEIH